MYLDAAVKAISGWEGRANWMYLDSRGNVTIGVGQLIASAQDAIPFHFRRPNADFATNAEIEQEYNLVKTMFPGHVAAAYRRSNSLLLPDTDIDLILKRTLIECAADLSHQFADFVDFPDAVKLALLDMRFNLGERGLETDFPRFCIAVESQQWDAAGALCQRRGPNAARNAWTRTQFETVGNVTFSPEEGVA
jgi:hypothetical protein